MKKSIYQLAQDLAIIDLPYDFWGPQFPNSDLDIQTSYTHLKTPNPQLKQVCPPGKLAAAPPAIHWPTGHDDFSCLMAQMIMNHES